MFQIFGTIKAPDAITGRFGTVESGALGNLLSLVFRFLIVAGIIYALFNLVLTGYAFMSAGDDSKKIAGAWAKIWQTGIGLAFTAGAFVIAAIFSKLIFGDYTTILNPTIPTLR